MTAFYTRTGDGGTSGLYGTDERVPKTSPVYDALGTLDELNSLLGYCYARAHRSAEHASAVVCDTVHTLQQHLFVVQAELAGADKRVTDRQVRALEEIITGLAVDSGNPHGFVVAGATELSALLDWARAVSRRAERTVLALTSTRGVPPEMRRYLNRLSSVLYVLARYAAAAARCTEPSPRYQ